MRRDCWDDTEALDFSHIYLETILQSNPSWTLSPLCFKFLNGRKKMLKGLYHLSQHGILISQPRILPFMPVLVCPACLLSQGLQWMSAASAFCLAWKHVIPLQVLEQKPFSRKRTKNADWGTLMLTGTSTLFMQQLLLNVHLKGKVSQLKQ